MNAKMSKLALAIAAMVMAGSVWAGTDSVDLTVTAAVDKACVVGTPTTMAFGSLALLDATTGKVVTTGNDDAVGSFFTACTTGSTTVTYAFTGLGASGFRMSDGVIPSLITYTLFSDSARTVGLTRAAAAASSAFAGFAADGANHELSVYGRVDLASNVTKPVGSYSDTVTVTVSYD